MNGLTISFQYTPGARGVYVKELTGADELSVTQNNTDSLISLLQLLIATGTKENTLDATRIVTADRDRLIARLHISLYGSKIASTVDCAGCGQKFDFDFSLDDLLAHFQQEKASIPEDGIYEAEPGIRFRLPTGEDEIAVKGYNKDTAERMLLQRCMVSGNPETDSEKVQLKMAEVAPVLSQEMNAVCPECSRVQKMHFDMQSFFITRLVGEKQNLFDEIHLIASQYHWSHQEILDLPRSLRKQYATLIKGN